MEQSNRLEDIYCPCKQGFNRDKSVESLKKTLKIDISEKLLVCKFKKCQKDIDEQLLDALKTMFTIYISEMLIRFTKKGKCFKCYEVGQKKQKDGQKKSCQCEKLKPEEYKIYKPLKIINMSGLRECGYSDGVFSCKVSLIDLLLDEYQNWSYVDEPFKVNMPFCQQKDLPRGQYTSMFTQVVEKISQGIQEGQEPAKNKNCLCREILAVIYSQKNEYQIDKNQKQGRPRSGKTLQDKIKKIIKHYTSKKVQDILLKKSWEAYLRIAFKHFSVEQKRFSALAPEIQEFLLNCDGEAANIDQTLKIFAKVQNQDIRKTQTKKRNYIQTLTERTVSEGSNNSFMKNLVFYRHSRHVDNQFSDGQNIGQGQTRRNKKTSEKNQSSSPSRKQIQKLTSRRKSNQMTKRIEFQSAQKSSTDLIIDGQTQDKLRKDSSKTAAQIQIPIPQFPRGSPSIEFPQLEQGPINKSTLKSIVSKNPNRIWL